MSFVRTSIGRPSARGDLVRRAVSFMCDLRGSSELGRGASKAYRGVRDVCRQLGWLRSARGKGFGATRTARRAWESKRGGGGFVIGSRHAGLPI